MKLFLELTSGLTSYLQRAGSSLIHSDARFIKLVSCKLIFSFHYLVPFNVSMPRCYGLYSDPPSDLDNWPLWWWWWWWWWWWCCSTRDSLLWSASSDRLRASFTGFPLAVGIHESCLSTLEGRLVASPLSTTTTLSLQTETVGVGVQFDAPPDTMI